MTAPHIDFAFAFAGSLQFLKRAIQEGTHDSAQDAKAAMDLALLKIRKGVCVWGGGLW